MDTMIEVIKGNILESKADYILIPVNCVGVAGKGLAKAAKDKWFDWYVDYEKLCSLNKVHPNSLMSYRLQTGQLLINFPTKIHWKNNSSYELIFDGMKRLLTYIPFITVSTTTPNKLELTIDIPALGCGCGELDWKFVKPQIIRIIEENKNEDLKYIKWRLYEPI
jgi:O-acetyl-ADP-ribose deacetylase (regulator of RNase III)